MCLQVESLLGVHMSPVSFELQTRREEPHLCKSIFTLRSVREESTVVSCDCETVYIMQLSCYVAVNQGLMCTNVRKLSEVLG